MTNFDSSFLPQVSIIIPVYNGANYLRYAIDSALAQTYPNFEVIVVNDGSKDNGDTRKVAESFGNKIRYFEKENGGVATALNFGIEKMSGQFFSWLSHDDAYLPQKLEKQVDVLSQLPSGEKEQTVVYCDWQLIDSNGVFGSRVRLLDEQRNLAQLEIPLYPLVSGLLHGCALLVPVKKLKQVGGFDPQLRTTQDVDCWLKILKTSKIKYIPEALILSRVHPEQGSKKIKSHHTESNQLWIHILSSLTVEDMISMEGSVDCFFLKFAKFMKAHHFESAFQETMRVWKKKSPTGQIPSIKSFEEIFSLRKEARRYLVKIIGPLYRKARALYAAALGKQR